MPGCRNVPGTFGAYSGRMSRIVSRARIAQVAAVLLGLVVLGAVASTVVLDTLVHTPGTGGPVVESLSIAAAAIPATSVGVLLAARRPGNPIGWLLFGILLVGTSPTGEYDIQTVDFDAVRDDLVGVVHEAFQPTQVSMWLVEAGSGRDTGSVRG
jgi:hypothetical protein